MIKTCTGSQEVQQLWQTEAVFQQKTIVPLRFSTIRITSSSSSIFFPEKSACDFGPSGEPRLISSSFCGVLILGQSFRKDAKIVDRRFSVISSKKKSHFVGLSLSASVFSASTVFLNLSKRFCNHHLSFHLQGTLSLFSTPDCQSDPEWNAKIKLGAQDFLAGCLYKI